MRQDIRATDKKRVIRIDDDVVLIRHRPGQSLHEITMMHAVQDIDPIASLKRLAMRPGLPSHRKQARWHKAND